PAVSEYTVAVTGKVGNGSNAEAGSALVSEKSAGKAKESDGDDLTVIEGIGRKMAGALSDAGIDTYTKLAEASEDDIRAAIENAGMRFAPSLETWAEQATYAARGD